MFCTVYYSIADGKMVPYRHELQKHGIIQYGKPWLSVCLIFFIVPGLAPTYVEKAKFSLAGTDDLSRSCQEVLRGVNGRRFVENISPEFIRFLIDAYTVM